MTGGKPYPAQWERVADLRVFRTSPEAWEKLIAWRTDGSLVEHAGSVNFEARPDGTTLVCVELQYNPPGGELAHMVSALFGADPGARIKEDLERLKEALGRAQEDRDGLQPATASALGYRPPAADTR